MGFLNEPVLGAMATNPIPIAPKPREPLHENPQLGHPTLAPPATKASAVPSSQISTYMQSIDVEQYQSPYATGLSNSSTLILSPVFSKETSEVIARVKANGVHGLAHGSSDWETAKQAVKAEIDSLAKINGLPSKNSSISRTGGRRGRGPRRRGSPVASGTIVLTPRIAPISATPPNSKGRSRSRGGRSRGIRGRGGSSTGKRKREHGSESDGNSTSSSEEVTALPLQSRSGRKIFQAGVAAPVIKPEPGASQASVAASSISIASPSTSAAKKKSFRRMPGASAVCKNCGRGHSPLSNAIVFCDGCNTPWHQFCHGPSIKPEYLLIAEKEWFCGDCMILREDRVKLEGKVAGDGMTLFEKRKYLRSLSSGTLVSLLVHASSLHPSLPIFPPKTLRYANKGAEGAEAYEENELLYPKAGSGIPLPPESEDLSILVDDDTVTYSHQWEGIAEMMQGAKKAVNGVGGNLAHGDGLGSDAARVKVGAC